MLVRSVTVVLAGVGLPGLPARAAEPLVEVPAHHRTAFSPNGDGHKDTLPVRFRLDERARVTIRVPGVGTVDLGVRGPGPRVWRWDGKGAPNGSYRLVLRARTADGRTGRATRYAEIDRGESLDAVRIYTTRTTVYPQTPGKQDRIYVRSTKYGNATGVTIRDQAGDVVVEDEFWQWWSWDGGQLPAGQYAATFSLRDRFGNHRTVHRTLTISADQLHQGTWSMTVRAAEVDRAHPPVWCEPTPSPRFDGGLTVARGPGCDLGGLVPLFPIPVDVDPDVTWRLTVAGSGDQVRVVIADGSDVVATSTPVGDGTTTTPWGGPHPYEWDPEREPEPTGWVVVDEEGRSYDVARLTLEVRYWTASAAPGRDLTSRG